MGSVVGFSCGSSSGASLSLIFSMLIGTSVFVRLSCGLAGFIICGNMAGSLIRTLNVTCGQ